MKHFFTVSVFGLALLSLSREIGAQKMGATIPIVDVKSGYLLGGSRNGKWLNAKTTAPAIKNSDNYRVFSATRSLGNGTASRPKSQGAPCEETLFSKIAPASLRSGAEFAIGGAHTVFPRAYRTENPNGATYRNIVAAILKSHGIPRPVTKITQIWSVDLDGDGTREVLLSATRKAEAGDPQSIAPASRAGEYSLILLRKIVGGAAKNILLESEFYPRAKEFNAPAFYRLAAVFDANGDGKMEILIRGRYYEGDWTSLYEIGGAKPREVLSESCGV